MKTPRLVTILAALALPACMPQGGESDPVDDPGEDPGDTDPGTGLTGDVTADTTWTGDVDIGDSVVIKSGVTVTVAAGARLRFANDGTIGVEGTLSIEGADGQLVTLEPQTAGARWGGITAVAGGSVAIRFADVSGAVTVLTCASGAAGCAIEDSSIHDVSSVAQFQAAGTIDRSILADNGAVNIVTGGDVTITDSVLTGSGGDLLVQSGGKLNVQYSEVGSQASSEHCGFHVNSAEALRVENSIIHEQAYGFMLGGVTGAEITHNNFTGNTVDIDDMGNLVNVVATNNYWTAAPASANIDVTSPAATAFTDVGPR